MRYLAILLFLLLFLGSCSSTKTSNSDNEQTYGEVNIPDLTSTKSIGELLLGWDEMLKQIEKWKFNTEKLKKRQYNLKVKLQGSWNLEIIPKEAFLIERGSEETDFRVTINHPKKLYEESGGLVKATYIQAKLSKVGGSRGSISLTGKLGCLYPISYYQRQGKLVDLSKIKTSYLIEYVISRPKVLKLVGHTQYAAIFKRLKDNNGKVTVKIKLNNKKTSETYLGDEILIPGCVEYQQQQGDELFMPMTANRCIHHDKTVGEVFIEGRDRVLRNQEIFTNSCNRQVECVMTVKFAYLQDKKIVYVEKKDFKFDVPANGGEEVKVNWVFNTFFGDYNATLYDAAKTGQRSTLVKQDDAGLKCKWKRVRKVRDL